MPSLDLEKIKTILPHRYPMLMVDAVLDYTSDKISGIKEISSDEFFLKGHFPNNPIFPGTFFVEAMSQLSNILMYFDLKEKKYHNMIFLFMTIESAKFREQARPGDTLYIEAIKKHSIGNTYKFEGMIRINNRIVAEAVFSSTAVSK